MPATVRFEQGRVGFGATLTSLAPLPTSGQSRRCDRWTRLLRGAGSGSTRKPTHARFEVVAHAPDVALPLRDHIWKQDGATK
jgi:hypothetical protein